MTEPAETPTPDCAAFRALLNCVLDGEGAAAELAADPHPITCAACREDILAARTLVAALRAAAPVMPSARFVDDVTRAAVRDFRLRRRQRVLARVGGFAVAAALLVGLWATWPRTSPVAVPIAVKLPAGGVQQPLADAGTAAAKLTGKVADEMMVPARNLFASLDRPKVTVPTLAVRSTPDIERATRAGLAPLANTTRRAFDLFVRDIGGAAGKSKS